MRAGVHRPTYNSWQMMKNRCLNPNAEDYSYYGLKGVKVDPAWFSYDGFVADMGLRPDGLTLDRINGDADYVLSNCRWASKQTQARNRKYTVDLTYEGRTQKVWEWAEELGVKPMTMHFRRYMLHQGLINLPQVFCQNQNQNHRKPKS